MKLSGHADSRKMVGRIRGVKTAFRAAHERGMRIESNLLLERMRDRTPVDMRPNAPHPGALRNSGRVEVTHKSADVIEAQFTFGDDGIVNYAVYVHENLEAHHTVGQAKYVESVLNEDGPDFLAKLAPHVHFDSLSVQEE